MLKSGKKPKLLYASELYYINKAIFNQLQP